jgi:hypothetical protein
MVKSAERRGFLPSLKDFYSMISEQPVTNPGLPDGGLMFSFRRMWTTVREFEDIRYREKGTHLFLCWLGVLGELGGSISLSLL